MGNFQSLKSAQRVNPKKENFQTNVILNKQHRYEIYRVKLGRSSQLSFNVEGRKKRGKFAVEMYALKGKHSSVLKRIGKTEFQDLSRKDIRKNLQNIYQSRQKGTVSRTQSRELEKGVYYLCIRRIKNTVKYTLDITSNQLGNNQEQTRQLSKSPGGSEGFSPAFDLSTFNPNTQTLGTLASSVDDWFNQNFRDPGLQATARSLFHDDALSRTDMLTIFASTIDEEKVDAVELADLQTLVANHEYLGLADHVRVLADKVVNGTSANTFYQGGTLGNLDAGSSSEHLNALVNKWFMGGDRPAPPEGFTMTYAKANGSLFGTDNTPYFQDVRQGYLSDCYFLSALGANALHQPETIRNMFIDNGDGTFTVKFYGQNNGRVVSEADYVTVDSWLPTHISDGEYANQNFAAFDSHDRGLWVALAEKAYAQFAESGISFRPVPINSYEAINYGKGFRAMAAISGNDGKVYTGIPYGFAQAGNFPAFEVIDSLIANHTPTVASTISDPGLGIVNDHQYIIVSTDLASQTLTLYNPHGTRINPRPGEDAQGFRVISYQDFAANFDTVEFQEL
ncbi:MAG: C2 family cysteine protease [Cyanobacteria bacterium P01_F01_bin.150]